MKVTIELLPEAASLACDLLRHGVDAAVVLELLLCGTAFVPAAPRSRKYVLMDEPATASHILSDRLVARVSLSVPIG
jgi:hypothetical protein